MDNDQQAAILALIVTALKTVRAAREESLLDLNEANLARGVVHLLHALEQDAIIALENLPGVTQ
jgi:hypothetical protein